MGSRTPQSDRTRPALQRRVWRMSTAELVTLSQGERSFYHRVVTAIPTPVHDYIRVMFANKGLPRLAGELSALVRLDQNLVL